MGWLRGLCIAIVPPVVIWWLTQGFPWGKSSAPPPAPVVAAVAEVPKLSGRYEGTAVVEIAGPRGRLQMHYRVNLSINDVSAGGYFTGSMRMVDVNEGDGGTVIRVQGQVDGDFLYFQEVQNQDAVFCRVEAHYQPGSIRGRWGLVGAGVSAYIKQMRDTGISEFKPTSFEVQRLR